MTSLVVGGLTEEDELLIELSRFGLKSEATRGVQRENGPSDSLSHGLVANGN